MKTTNKLLSLSLILIFACINTYAQCEYEEKNGYVIMEAENTKSPYDLWVLKTDVANYKGSGHLEFTGNSTGNGPAKSFLEYKFKINKGGVYRLIIRSRKRITPPDGSDKSNDSYVRVEGDYDERPGNGNASIEVLKADTKMFGGSPNAWGWSERLDLGGHNNKRTPRYVFKAGETYTFVMSGRSKQYNVDRIIFFLEDDHSINDAKDDSNGIEETTCGDVGPNACVENPILIEAECYTNQSGVQSEPCDEGGLNIGWINEGDWMSYRDVDMDNFKSVNFRVASNFAGGTIELRLNSTSGQLLSSIPISNTGGNQVWETVTANIENASGIQDVYLVFKGGNGFLYNINHFGFSAETLSIDDTDKLSVTTFPNPVINTLNIQNGQTLNIEVYNSLGQLQFKNKVLNNEYKLDMSTYSSGLYFLKMDNGKTVAIQKVIKK